LISKGFIKSSLIYTVAGALPAASAFILLPFYLEYLPEELYGALAICLSFSVFAQILVTYSFDTSLYIHYHELKNDRAKLGAFVSSVFIFLIGWGMTASLILSIAGQFIFDWIFPESKLSFFPFGLMAVSIGVFQAIFKVHSNFLQTREKPEPFFWSNVVSFTVLAVLTILGLQLYPGTLTGPLGARMIVGFGTMLWVLFRIFREYGIHFKSPWKTTSASFNAYTFVYQLQQWGVNYLDKFIIPIFIPVGGMATVGIYDFAQKCLAPIELLLNGLNASIFPKVIKLIHQQPGDKSATVEINRYFYGLVSVIILVVTCSVFVLPWLIEVFVQKDGYRRAVEYVPYLAVIFVLRAMRLYFVVPNNAMKRMQRITFVNLLVVAFKIVAMIILIAQWGIYGVILSAGLAYLVEMILLGYYLRNDYTMRFNVIKLVIVPLTLVCLIVVGEAVLAAWVNTTLLHGVYIILCLTLLLFSYRKEIGLIVPTLK
jgi:O-antigen/teichoic acid export membrane protein